MEYRLTYKGYIARLTTDTLSGRIFGEVMGIGDVISPFEASTSEQIELEFHKTVDIYLASCLESGIEPIKSFSGKLPFCTSPEIHQNIYLTATQANKSINTWIEEILSEAVSKKSSSPHDNEASQNPAQQSNVAQQSFEGKERNYRDLLIEGAYAWNAWRQEYPGLTPDLSGLDLSGLAFRGADLRGVNFAAAVLSRADLCGADLSSANLSGADLHNSQLVRANLIKANLSGASFRGADLSQANLIAVQALSTDFTHSILTGACLDDWNISSTTKLDKVICDYVYLKSGQRSRRPSSGTFALGEFTALFHKVLETVDLIFADGIDWKAFFQSFQELRSQYDDKNFSIQAIERKSDDAFVIRLEVPPEVDKSTIESRAKELYQVELQFIEELYRAQLNAKDIEIEIYKKQNTDMVEITKVLASKSIVEESKVRLNSNQIRILKVIGSGIFSDNDISKATSLSIETVRYYMQVMEAEGYLLCAKYMSSPDYEYNCQLRDKGRVAVEDPDLLIPLSSNATTIHAGNVGFIQSGSGTVSHFSQTIGQNADEIIRLITTLREQAQQFPDNQRDDALMRLDDLQQDLSTPEKREPNRIKRRIIALLTIAGILGTTIATVTDFANNVFELADKVGIPKSELLQYVPTHLLPPSNQPPQEMR